MYECKLLLRHLSHDSLVPIYFSYLGYIYSYEDVFNPIFAEVIIFKSIMNKNFWVVKSSFTADVIERFDFDEDLFRSLIEKMIATVDGSVQIKFKNGSALIATENSRFSKV